MASELTVTRRQTARMAHALRKLIIARRMVKEAEAELRQIMASSQVEPVEQRRPA